MRIEVYRILLVENKKLIKFYCHNCILKIAFYIICNIFFSFSCLRSAMDSDKITASSTKLRCFSPSVNKNELYHRPSGTISWQCIRRWTVDDKAISIIWTLPTNGKSAHVHLCLLGLDLSSDVSQLCLPDESK